MYVTFFCRQGKSVRKLDDFIFEFETRITRCFYRIRGFKKIE